MDTLNCLRPAGDPASRESHEPGSIHAGHVAQIPLKTWRDSGTIKRTRAMVLEDEV
jgi:hypothetical protein